MSTVFQVGKKKKKRALSPLSYEDWALLFHDPAGQALRALLDKGYG